jgi:hypothetical protein
VWSEVATDQSENAEFSGIFMAVKGRTALAVANLVIWLHVDFFLVKIFLMLIFVWKPAF